MLQMHSRDASKAQRKQAQIAQIMIAENRYKQPVERKLVSNRYAPNTYV